MSLKKNTVIPESRTVESGAGTECCASALNPLLTGPLREPAPEPHGGSVAIGRIVAMDASGPSVDVPGMGVRRARALCVLPVDWADRECAVLFENGDVERPLVVGLLMDSIALAAPQATGQELEVVQPLAEAESSPERELVVDGERLVIHADTELELRCGESVILLQRDGRIEIRGNYITSQATATQRLRGGSIHMN